MAARHTAMQLVKCGRVAALCGTEDRRPGLFITGNDFIGPEIATCFAQAGETAAVMTGFLPAMPAGACKMSTQVDFVAIDAAATGNSRSGHSRIHQTGEIDHAG